MFPCSTDFQVNIHLLHKHGRSKSQSMQWTATLYIVDRLWEGKITLKGYINIGLCTVLTQVQHLLTVVDEHHFLTIFVNLLSNPTISKSLISASIKSLGEYSPPSRYQMQIEAGKLSTQTTSKEIDRNQSSLHKDL